LTASPIGPQASDDLQRVAETMATPTSAPLASERLLGAFDVPSAGDATHDEPAVDRAGSMELPLVNPSSSRAAESSAPTLGAMAPMIDASPMTSNYEAARTLIGPTVESLPLAPPEPGTENLPAPPGRAPDATAGAAVQRQSESGGATVGMPLAAPRAAASASSFPSSFGPARADADGGVAPIAAGNTISTLSPLSVSSAPPSVQRTASGAGSTMPGGGSALDQPVAIRRVPSDGMALAMASGAATGLVTSTAPASVQRAGETGTSPSGAPLASGRSSTPDMPLHTPAASMPSATDILVGAGLAERGPNGAVFYTSLPGASAGADAGETPATVQRSVDTSSSANDLPIQRAIDVGDHPGPAGSHPSSPVNSHGEVEHSPGLLDAAEQLADQARKLYPHIRTQLESDIRRQLEARSRAGRYRP